MDIGSSIRAIRKRKNITIAQMCEKTGLSQGFMSQVETNKTSPSISTLENIAEALEVPLPYLLLRKDERMSVTRKDERAESTSGPDQLRVYHLGSTRHVRMVIAESQPGESTGREPRAHEGEEVHLVLKGRILAEQGEDRYELAEGDSFSWHACTPHRVTNIGDETALILIAVYTDEPNEQKLL